MIDVNVEHDLSRNGLTKALIIGAVAGAVAGMTASLCKYGIEVYKERREKEKKEKNK